MSLRYCPECGTFQNKDHFASTPHEPGRYPSRLSPELVKSHKEQFEYIRELTTDLHAIYLESKNVGEEIEHLRQIRSKIIKELRDAGYSIKGVTPK